MRSRGGEMRRLSFKNLSNILTPSNLRRCFFYAKKLIQIKKRGVIPLNLPQLFDYIYIDVKNLVF